MGSLVALIALLLVACGAAAPATPAAPKAQEPAPAKGVAAQPAATPTAAPKVAAPPAVVKSAKDRVILVTSEEPLSLEALSNRCTSTLISTMCSENVNEPLTWIDSNTLQVVPLSGIDGWSQEAPNRWRFTLRKGVKFHNDEPWDAAAAKFGLDIGGDVTHGLGSFSYHGPITAAEVDEFTVDVVCGRPCPIFPRSALFTRFQAPKWYKAASEEERTRKEFGHGPYKVVQWRPGVDITFEAYENYRPNPQTADAQAPVIRRVTQLWRGEALVRAAMVKTGEADLAVDIGFENRQQVPAFKQSGTVQIYTLILDTMWHPELKKKQVRQALAHAIDCQALVKALYEGLVQCYGAISVPGTVGITPKNSAPYEYNPTLARQWLRDAKYDRTNEVIVYVIANWVHRNVELVEAVAGYWKELGVNARIQVVESSKHSDIRISGCGNFAKAPGYGENLDCAQRTPPGPISSSSHMFDVPTSNEILDYQRMGLLWNSCFNTRSRVCYPELEAKINVASATPEGPERTRRMEEIADIVHDEYYFIPFFHVQVIYGMSKDLVWEPRYDPRIRVNTMRFK